MYVLTLCDWFSSSASACDSDDPVFYLVMNDGVVSGIRTMFSLIVKFYVSDYDFDSDSVAREASL